jgi:hypothetical protein
LRKFALDIAITIAACCWTVCSAVLLLVAQQRYVNGLLFAIQVDDDSPQ